MNVSRGEEIFTKPKLRRFKPIFNEAQGKVLAVKDLDLDQRLMPLSKRELKMKIKYRIDKKNKAAGKNFYYKFLERHPYIPNSSKLTSNLRNLTRNEVQFEWTEAHSNELEKLKHILVNKAVLNIFYENQQTIMQSDASSEGLGARKNLVVADTLSRAYINTYTPEDEEMQYVIHALINNISISPEKKILFQQATQNDPTLKDIFDGNYWKKGEVKDIVNERSYIVQDEFGKTYHRNRKFLNKTSLEYVPKYDTFLDDDQLLSNDPHTPEQLFQPENKNDSDLHYLNESDLPSLTNLFDDGSEDQQTPNSKVNINSNLPVQSNTNNSRPVREKSAPSYLKDYYLGNT
ncbi:hypothetical protein ILUMI_26829 [Ignelater luminosus]|uniref:Reverse transcriptase/retrotransposon-derived protein RNase H-like domain-containing protein n=1 Tax=Ignelater luminosus TaxID=2038154 RepID=A0A8K0C7A6_IGNLU|nr:hypothetical protein ILUMI_26829 [Ignelater luminosus]